MGMERYITALSRKFGARERRRGRKLESPENMVEISTDSVQENKVLILESKVLLDGFSKWAVPNAGQYGEIRPLDESTTTCVEPIYMLPRITLSDMQQTETRQSIDSNKTADVTNPISHGGSTMVCGDFQTGARRDILVKNSQSQDESLLVSGHWGASGDIQSLNPRSSGRSITIIGNVGSSATADEVYRSLQQSKHS